MKMQLKFILRRVYDVLSFDVVKLLFHRIPGYFLLIVSANLVIQRFRCFSSAGTISFFINSCEWFSISIFCLTVNLLIREDLSN